MRMRAAACAGALAAALAACDAAPRAAMQPATDAAAAGSTAAAAAAGAPGATGGEARLSGPVRTSVAPGQTGLEVVTWQVRHDGARFQEAMRRHGVPAVGALARKPVHLEHGAGGTRHRELAPGRRGAHPAPDVHAASPEVVAQLVQPVGTHRRHHEAVSPKRQLVERPDRWNAVAAHGLLEARAVVAHLPRDHLEPGLARGDAR
ncbi:MAG: hypothetical protein ACKOFI_07550, partial [Phycisphaerales bacterium]